MKPLYRLLSVCLASLSLLTAGGCTGTNTAENLLFSSTATWFGTTEKGLIPIRSPQEFPGPEWRFWTRATAPSALISASVVGKRHAFVGISNAGVWDVSEGLAGLVIAPLGQAGLMQGYTFDRFFAVESKVYLALHSEPGTLKPEALPPAASLAWFTPGQPELYLLPVPFQVNNPQFQAVGFAPGTHPSEVRITWKALENNQVRFAETLFQVTTGLETAEPATTGRPLPFQPQADLQALVKQAKLVAPAGTPLQVHPADPTRPAAETWLAVKGNGPVWQLFYGQAAGHSLLLAHAGHLFIRHQDGALRQLKLPDLGPFGFYSGLTALDQGVLLSWELRKGPMTGPAGVLYIPARLLQ